MPSNCTHPLTTLHGLTTNANELIREQRCCRCGATVSITEVGRA